MRFRVLGPVELVDADGEPRHAGGPKPLAVLGVLLAHAGHTVSAEHLIAQVWGDEPPATAGTALHVHISALRKVVGAQLVTVGSGYRLNAETDADQFVAAVDSARAQLATHPARAVTEFADALAMWRGDPYGDVGSGADVEAARVALTELRLAATEDRIEAELALGRHRSVLAELAGLVVAHPLRERLARLRLLALYRDGRHAEARDAYRELCERLDAELGEEPADETAALAKAVRRRDPALDPPSAIPAPPSRFVGRRRELDELIARLGVTRLLTITGTGGAGKTRLALELAGDAVPDHPDGVYVVWLAAETDGGAVADRIAAALELPSAQLVNRLKRGRCLLVLDNCEHLVDGCATVAGDLLSHCAGLRIIATSREPLGVPGEQVWPLCGLSVPSEDDDAATISRSEAVRLLAARGASARPGFTVRHQELAIAGRLCRDLDGLPLAIELAAAQLRALSLGEVVENLEKRLDLTDHRARTTPERHRSMRAAIESSHRLLTGDERTAFRRLAVFAGGFEAPAAERVADVPQDVLLRLADRSLLTAVPGADRTRYHLLELVRDYATDRLAESGETADARRRHTDWCVELAETSVPSGNDPAVVHRLLAELDNLRAAVHWCLGDGDDAGAVVRIVTALWWFCWPQGLAPEAYGWLRRAMDGGTELPPELHARAMHAETALAMSTGDVPRALDLAERTLAAYRELDDVMGTIGALAGLCYVLLETREFARVLELAEECRAIAVAADAELLLISVLNPWAQALDALGRHEEAVAMFRQALEGFRAAGERGGEASTVNNLAVAHLSQGDLGQARSLFMDSLAMFRDLDLTLGEVEVLEGLASLELAEDNPETALRMLTITARARERFGTPSFGPDRQERRENTLAAAHGALGAAADAVVSAARSQPLATLVDDLLSQASP
ncbi:BTAD domain-containing putative transcriptional regulator [Amycolatopsis sp. NPDC059657]|uniref:BTAD domain-containing putative transcriptional regulator n=1 Tax=Amycolatopsis sp. NPDC059657 TaxID=3346899 RepID=UPI00366CC5CA